MLIAGLVLGTAAVAVAGPGPQYWQTLNKESDFKQLKPGDKIVYVCSQCQTVTEKTIESTTEAMDHCKEAATIMCPSCKMKVKVTMKQARNDPPDRREITYVNEKGEPCFFVAKVMEKK